MVVLMGCGGTSRPRAHEKAARTSSAPQIHFGIEPAALVTMREYSPQSLMWQNLSLKADGTGVLTTLIGEISGAVRKSIQLPARQAAVLRRLVAGARSVPPPQVSEPSAELYTLHISGKPSANIQGPTPKQLAALLHFLSGLMLSYCC